MFSIARYSRCSPIIPKVRYLFSNPSINIAKNVRLRSYLTPVLRCQPIRYNPQVKNVLRGSGTVAVRLGSNVAGKGQKVVGYWLLTCGGMVFIAVVLGISVYCAVLGFICVVLGEVVKRTVK